MLAKKTSKNQITLPKVVVTHFEGVEYFDVTTDGTTIVLRPLARSRADEVRAKLEQLGSLKTAATTSQGGSTRA